MLLNSRSRPASPLASWETARSTLLPQGCVHEPANKPINTLPPGSISPPQQAAGPLPATLHTIIYPPWLPFTHLHHWHIYNHPRPYPTMTDSTHRRGPLQSLFEEHPEYIYPDIATIGLGLHPPSLAFVPRYTLKPLNFHFWASHLDPTSTRGCILLPRC